jgi:hypothetical protein
MHCLWEGVVKQFGSLNLSPEFIPRICLPQNLNFEIYEFWG